LHHPALRDAGAEPVSAPAIVVEAPVDASGLERAVTSAGDYAWIVFTSANGVERFFGELHAQGADARRLGGARIAAIGPATAERLRAFGVRADCMPDEYRGEAVAEALIAQHGGPLAGCAVLLPRAAVARDALPERLRAAGARVDVVEAYRTRGPNAEEAAALLRALHEVDSVTFTSSSTVEQTLLALGDTAATLLSALTVASIGPITTETAQRHALRVDVTAREYTVAGLVDALEQHYAARATGVRD
jgi:uroporphyrinogen III methyltransferase/synthase